MPKIDDLREPQSLGDAPDPVALTGRWTREPHPLFPRDDGSPEDRDIEYVTFRRRRTGDGLVQNYPEDIPARDVQSWIQVVLWWGGGDYKAIGKNAKHQIQACYPAATDAWESFDGESKPFTLRDGSPYAPLAAVGAPTPARSHVDVVPARAALAPPAGTTAPNAIDGVLGTMSEMLREMRVSRAPAPPTTDGPLVALLQAHAASIGELVKEVREMKAAPATARQGGSDAMVAMMNNQATLQAAQIKADAEVRAAQIKAEADARAAQAQATAENNKFLLGVMTRGGGGEDKLANLLALLKPYLQPPPSAAPQQDVLSLLERARDLFPQSAPAAASEIKPIADMFGSFMTQSLVADAKKAEAAADLRKVEIQAARASDVPTPRREREPPPLVHVTGLGMVHVVAPEATLTFAPAPAAPVAPAPAPAAPAMPAPAAPAVPAPAPAALAMPAPAAPAVPAPAPAAPAMPAPAPAAPAPAAPAMPAPAAPAVPAPAPAAPAMPAPAAPAVPAPAPAAPAMPAPAAPAVPAPAPAALAMPAPAAPAVPAPAPAAPAMPAPAPAAPAPAAPAMPAPAAPAVPAPAPAAPAMPAPAPAAPAAPDPAPAAPAPAAPAMPAPAAPAVPLEAPVGSEAPVAPSGPTEPATPSDHPAATPRAPQAEPPPTMVAAPPVVAVEMPAEVRTVLQQAVQVVTDDDRAEFTGKLGRMKDMSLAERASVFQRLWPFMSSRDAEQAAEMIVHLPMLDIHNLVAHLGPAEFAQARQANVLKGTRDPGS